MENLIKLKESPSRHVIDNIMIRLRDMQISRAMLSMSGDLEVSILHGVAGGGRVGTSSRKADKMVSTLLCCTKLS